MEEDDPFSAVDVEVDLTSLIHDVVPNCCSSDEYINGEDSIPVCNDLDSLTWEEDFMHQLGQVGGEEECDEDEKDDSEQLPISNVKTYKDAILALEDIKHISRKSRSLNGVNQDWHICGFIGFITTCSHETKNIA